MTGFSRSYISQVKHGSRPASKKFFDALSTLWPPVPEQEQIKAREEIAVQQESGDDRIEKVDYLELFLESRKAIGVSPSTLKGYKWALGRFIKQVGHDYANANSREIQAFLNTIPPNHYGYSTRHTYYRAIKTFYRWLNLEFDLPNPIIKIRAPILGKPILPSLTREQVLFLIDKTDCVRNKAIIALFAESGLRLFELSNIKPADIFWDQRIIQVLGKGRKEAFAPFGELSERYLKEWLSLGESSEENIWGIYQKGIRTMLARLERETGLTCNPHTFRRTFACLLRKAGVDTLTIKELGRWESLEMVQRYTRSFTFQDSLRFYKAPLG